jgi:hypothetical protein
VRGNFVVPFVPGKNTLMAIAVVWEEKKMERGSCRGRLKQGGKGRNQENPAVSGTNPKPAAPANLLAR